MKKIKTLFSFLCSVAFAFSLSAQVNVDTRSFIEVTGSAEMSIPPEEIELAVVLLEHEDENEKKVHMKTIEEDFYAILKKNDINVNRVTLSNLDAYHWLSWWQNRNEYYARKTININLNKETNFLKLVQDLNKKGIESIRIVGSKHPDIQKFREEVKIEAVKAAKKKATYLLESIGERLGPVISIQEVPEYDHRYVSSGVVSNALVFPSSEMNEAAIQNVASIRLRYEVKAKFQIK